MSTAKPSDKASHRSNAAEHRRHPLLWRWWRASRVTRIVLVSLVALLIIGRLVMPFGIKSYVNRQLKRSPDYTGHIGDVTVHLYRGAYRIQDIEIFKKSGDIKEPFFAARNLDLSLQWKELFHGSVVGEVVMVQPRVNFVSGPTEAESQSGKNTAWDEMLKSLFPFKINRFEIQDGQIHFANHHSTPPVDVFVSELSTVATNLTNSRDLREPLPAGLIATARTLGDGSLDLNLRMNPLASLPTFEVICQLSNVDLVNLNDFLLAYGKFDVERGRFSLYTSVASKDGNYEGYFKPFFENLDVFNWQKEKNKNALQVAWQAIVGALTTIFKNQKQDTLATKVPISGTYQSSNVGIGMAVLNLLQNAFIQALVPKVDERVTLKKVDDKTKPDSPKPGKSSSPSASETPRQSPP